MRVDVWCVARGSPIPALLAALACAPAAASAQTPADSLAAEVARLRSTLDSLASEVARITGAAAQQPEQSEIERLRAAAAAAAAGGGAGAGPPPDSAQAQEFVGRERSLQALNPEISVTGDLFAQVITDEPRKENFFPREFEVSFVSNLDPYSRAKVFLTHHTPGGEIVPFPGLATEEGGGVEVEEGYVEWVGLPAGLGLKLGRFQQQFGQMNRWHSHALPFQARSLPHLAFIGEEALAQTGASVHWLLPLGGDGGGTYEATVEVTTSENEALFADSSRPAVLGHLNGFWILSPSLDLDVGLSWVNGSYEDETSFFDRNLLGAEFAFTWRPPAQALYRGVTVRGGVMALDGLVPGAGADRAWGYWALAEARLSQRWLAGARADRVENPLSPTETAWLLAPTLTWWQSEYVRLRLEYDVQGLGSTSSVAGRVLLQATFAMGPHKHEVY